MKTLNFKQLFGNEQIGGRVVFYDGDDFDANAFDSPLEFPSSDVWYEDFETGYDHTEPFGVSDLFRQAIDSIDLPAIARGYTDDDHNVCHIKNNVLTIINPTVFCDHRILITNTICDGDNDSMRYSHKISIEDLFCSIVEGYDLLKVLNPNEVLFERRGISYLFKVHFGDAEIQDAFLNSVRNIAEVI